MVRAGSGPPMADAKVDALKLKFEESLDENNEPINKRSRVLSPTHHQVMHLGVLDEPSPLGLRLRKSPSLVDLIQMRLAQGAATSMSCATSLYGGLDDEKKEMKSTAISSSHNDKLKASNFPLSLLRIGTWECVSRYEGDLVAKCYFAKHKLVWEVLEGGLKSKIEIQWSDITTLKATCPDDGVGTLDLVLARPPLFFRETDPQPRKHTLWQATQDFTNGQASINRRHLLQCARGLLSKNFEKLIQCNPRLFSLSQQPDIALNSPFFEPQCSAFESQNETEGHALNSRDDNKLSTFCDFSSGVVATLTTKSELPEVVGKALDFASRSVPTSCSEIGAQGVERSSRKTEEMNHLNWWHQLKVPGIRASMSVSDLVNHVEQHISDQLTSGNTSFSSGAIANQRNTGRCCSIPPQ